jgi:hypothetical protein
MKIPGRHLHVPRQHNQVDIILSQQRQFPRLRVWLALFRHWDMVIRNPIKIGVPFRVRKIADDQRDFASQLPVPLPVQQIHQAMIELRNENRHAGPVCGHRQPSVHRKFTRYRRKFARKIFHPQPKSAQIPLRPRQIKSLFPSLVLLKVQNVPIMSENKIGNGRIQPLLVRALTSKIALSFKVTPNVR